MKAEEIREGDIVEIDYIAEFTKEHINEGKALVIWKGFNHQPLVRKLNTKSTIWTSYEHIARVIGHTDIEGYMDDVLQEPFKPMVEIDLDYVIKQKYIEREVLDKIRAEIRHFMYDINPSSSESDYACNYILQIIDKYKADRSVEE